VHAGRQAGRQKEYEIFPVVSTAATVVRMLKKKKKKK
jgi:hypothetical protein